MIDPDELTLAGIDGIRHLITNELMVKAVIFAAWEIPNPLIDHRLERTVYRFVTALVMTNTLENGARWSEVLKAVIDLEAAGELMPSDRPTKPHGTFTPANTISRVLGAAGHRSFQVRRHTAFGGHRCSWDQDRELVRIVHWCGDDTPDDHREAERTEMLTAYHDVLVAAGYRVGWDARKYTLYVDPKKETS